MRKQSLNKERNAPFIKRHATDSMCLPFSCPHSSVSVSAQQYSLINALLILRSDAERCSFVVCSLHANGDINQTSCPDRQKGVTSSIHGNATLAEGFSRFISKGSTRHFPPLDTAAVTFLHCGDKKAKTHLRIYVLCPCSSCLFL